VTIPSQASAVRNVIDRFDAGWPKAAATPTSGEDHGRRTLYQATPVRVRRVSASPWQPQAIRRPRTRLIAMAIAKTISNPAAARNFVSTVEDYQLLPRIAVRPQLLPWLLQTNEAKREIRFCAIRITRRTIG
jgi:hypothetical protein